MTLFAAAIDTVPSTVPAPPPDGGGGGALAWWDDLVPVIAALVGAGLGFLASYVQSKKDRAHAESMAAANRKHTERMAQRHAVAEFLAESMALADAEKETEIYTRAIKMAWIEFKGLGDPMAMARREVERMAEPLWKRFALAHDVLQLSLTDPEVSKAAKSYYNAYVNEYRATLANATNRADLRRAATVFQDGPVSNPGALAVLARHRLTVPDTATPAPSNRRARWRKRRATPAANADPDE